MPHPAGRTAVFLFCCIVLAVIAAGCTAGTPPLPTSTPATPVATVSPTTPVTLPVVSLTGTREGPVSGSTSCNVDSDCVPAECCHPSTCINKAEKHVCTLLCTQECSGPIDCGAGSCGCVNQKCSVRAGPVP